MTLSEVKAEMEGETAEEDALLEKKKVSESPSPKAVKKEEKRPSVVSQSLVSDGKAKPLVKEEDDRSAAYRV